MKATIDNLWDTSRQILFYDDNDDECPKSFSDLKKCENVILGDKILGTKIREVLIDDSIVLVEQVSVKHPFGGRTPVLEVI